MPKTRNVILLVLIAVAAATVAPWVRERRERERTDAQAAARQSLDARLARVTYQQVPLARVIQTLGAQCGLPLYADWKRLREQGVDPDGAVTVQLPGPRLSEALDEVLESAARNASIPGSPATRLDYSVGPGGEVTIRPEQEIAAETSVLEVYDVRRVFDLEWLQRPHTPSPARLVEDTVMNGVSPDSWRDKWRHALCRYRDGRVLVLQTPERHREVDRCLAGLKRMHPDTETARLLRRLRGEEPR